MGFDYYYGYNNWASQFYNSTIVWENFKNAGKQKGYNTDVFTDKAMEFMSKQIDTENPFYVQLHYHAVHDSLEPRAPDKYFNQFTPVFLGVHSGDDRPAPFRKCNPIWLAVQGSVA